MVTTAMRRYARALAAAALLGAAAAPHAGAEASTPPLGSGSADLDAFLAGRVAITRPSSRGGAPAGSGETATIRESERERGAAAATPTFVRAFDNAVPPDLLARLLKDAAAAQRLGNEAKRLRYGKKATFWRGSESKIGGGGGAADTAVWPAPRFATEEAFDALRIVGLPDGEFERRGIVGAEWWYHVIPAGEGSIGFHYDKDEAVASEHMRMVFPDVSTVTYLTPAGGPTVVLNMTTSDGNRNTPPVAGVGFVSHPVVGRHTVFDGRLMHGVVAPPPPPPPSSSSSAHTGPPDAVRVTLLVNWWSRVPDRPNCRPLMPAEVSAFVGASGPPPPVAKGGGGTAAAAAAAAPLRPHGVSAKRVAGDDILVKINTQTHFYWLPRERPPGGFGRLRWNGTQSVGGVVVIDMEDEQVASVLARARTPRLVYFTPRGGLPEAKRVFFPAVKRLLGRGVLACVAEHGPRSAALWEAFGVSESDAPVVAIDDPATGRMRVARRPAGRERSSFAAADVVRLVDDFAKEGGRARGVAAKDEL